MQITNIENAIMSLDGIHFEEMVQDLIRSRYFFEEDFSISETGKIPGKHLPSTEQVDIWFSYKKDKSIRYYFVAVTKQKGNIFAKNGKARKDILDLIKEANKTSFDNITILFVCDQNPSPNQFSYLKDLCEENGMKFELWGLNTLTSLLRHNSTIASNYLHIEEEPNTLMPLADYLSNRKNDSNLDNAFLFRNDESDTLAKSIIENDKRVFIIHGPSGCGKTRLALEVGKDLQKNNDYYCYILKPFNFNSVRQIYDILPKNKRVLLIIDDANIYNYLNQHVDTILEMNNVSILMTIRDYLWNDFSKKVGHYFFELSLSVLKKAEIEEIVKKAYNVTNKLYLDYLYAISRNNLRFALMATSLFATKNEAPKSIADVLDDYYGAILKESDIDNSEGLKKTIIAISLLGRTDIRDIAYNTRICELFGINHDDFYQLCYEAQEKEFIGIYKDAVVEITDQVLAEYLVYKYVFLYKKIKLIDVFNFLYKNKQSRLVWLFRALLGIYRRKGVINEELDKLKDYCLQSDEQDKKLAFFKLFGDLFPNESISFAINGIKTTSHPFNGDYYNLLYRFSNESKHSSCVASHFVKLLKDKSTQEATTDYIFNHFKITIESLNNNYLFELAFLKCLIEESKLDSNLCSCLYKSMKNYYSYETNYSEFDNDNRQVFFKRFIIPFSEEYKQLRNLLWEGIDILYKNGYKKQTREFLSFNRFGSIEEIKKHRQFDKEKALNMLSRLDTNNREDLLLAFHLLAPFHFSSDVKSIFDALRSNKYVELFYTYVFETTAKHIYTRELEKDVEENFILQYEDNDMLVKDIIVFYNMFFDEQSWKVGELTTICFSHIAKQKDKSYDAFVKLFIEKCGKNICFNPCNIFEGINDKKELLSFLNNLNYANKELLITQLLITFKLEEIDNDVYDYALTFYLNRSMTVYGNDNILFLEQFESFKPGFLYQIIEKMNINESNYHFIEYLFFDDKNAQQVVSLFKNNYILLKEIYFKILKMSQLCDYHGVFLWHLYNVDSSVLDDYLDILLSGNSRIEICNWLFTFDGFVDSFIKYIERTKFVGLAFYVGHTVDKMPEDVFLSFVQQFIDKYKDDVYKMQDLSFIVAQRVKPMTKTLFFRKLVENNVPISALEKMELFDGPRSWSGSIVPYINSDIKEMNDILSQGFLSEEYASFLEKKIEIQEKRIKEEEILEFNRDDY